MRTPSKKTLMIAGTVAVFALGVGSANVFAQMKMHGHSSSGGHIQHDEVNMPMLHGTDTTELEVEELKAMFRNHSDITRSVELLPNGIKTLTETDNEELAAFVIGHAAGMINRVEENRDPGVPIQSPTLTPLFEKGHLIKTEIETTETGILVIQTSDDAEVVAALQKHAMEVSDLADRGMAAVHEQMMSQHHGN
jgi:hypothetical protein